MFEEPSEGPDDIYMPEQFFKNKADEVQTRGGPVRKVMPEYFFQKDTEDSSEGPDHINMPKLSPKKPKLSPKKPKVEQKLSKTQREKLAFLNKLSNSLRFNMDIDPTSDAPELVDPTSDAPELVEPTVEEATEALFLRTSLPTDPMDVMGSTCYDMQHPNLSLHCALWLYNHYHTVNRGWAQCSAFTSSYSPKCGYWWAKCKKNPRNKHCCISAHCHAKAKYGVNFGK